MTVNLCPTFQISDFGASDLSELDCPVPTFTGMSFHQSYVNSPFHIIAVFYIMHPALLCNQLLEEDTLKCEMTARLVFFPPLRAKF